jgi:acetylornithine deacetylase
MGVTGVLGEVFRVVDARQEDAIDFLRRLVALDTSVVNQGEYGGEGKAQPLVVERLRGLGCKVDVFEPDNARLAKYAVHFNPGRNYKERPNVVGTLKGRGGGRSLILSGHIDTVPFLQSEWTFPPLSGAIDSGRVYGRGAIDMKGGLAAMIMAVEAVQKAGVKPLGDIIIESVVDEEGGGNGTLACVDRGYLADAAIITEGTDERIAIANRGVLNVEVTVRGRASHAARKWAGVNAVEKMIKVIGGLGELERTWLATKRHSLLPSPTITVGQIEGGIGATVVPDRCVVKYDVKFLPYELDEHGSAGNVKREFEERVQLVASGDDWMRDHRPEIRWYSEVMPYELRPDDAFVVTTRRAASHVLSAVEVIGLAGGSDARIINNVGKVPTILFGPKGASAHGADEYMYVESYFRTTKALAAMLLEWCGYESGAVPTREGPL